MSFSQFIHGTVISQMIKLGLHPDPQGVCAGLTLLWLIYTIQGKEREYFNLIERICRSDFIEKYEKIKNKIALQADEIANKKENIRSPATETRKKILNLEKEIIQLKKEHKENPKIDQLTSELNTLEFDLLIQIRKRESSEADLEANEYYLSTEEKQILDAFPFLQWVNLTAQPLEYKKYLSASLFKSNIDELLSTVLAESKLKIENVHAEGLICNKSELQHYFDDLAIILKSLKEKNLPLLMQTDLHRIGIRFDEAKDCWILADPNQIPPPEINKDQIATKIMQAFKIAPKNPMEEKLIGFSVFMYSNQDSSTTSETKKVMETFKSKHIICKELTERKTINNATLLDHVVTSGDVITLKKMLDHKIDFEKAIKSASQYGHASIIKLLKPKVSDAIYVDSANTAALMGKTSSIKELLEEKPLLINSKNKLGDTLLHASAAQGHTSFLEFILEHKNFTNELLNTFNSFNYLPIDVAALSGHADTVQFLLSRGAKLTEKNIPIIQCISALEGHEDIIKILLQQNISLDHKGILFTAARNGHISIIKLLAEQKVNLNMTNSNGETPLYIATSLGHAELVKTILKLQTIDTQQYVGSTQHDTLMTTAVKAEHTSVMRVLAEYDWTLLSKPDKTSNTPVSLSIQTKDPRLMLKTLNELKQIYNEDHTLSLAAQNGNREALEKLIEKYSVSQLAFYSAERGYNNIIKQLAEKKLIDTPMLLRNIKDNPHLKQENLMAVATRHGYVPVIKTLMDCGLKIDEQMLLPLAFRALYKNELTLLELLIKQDSSIVTLEDKTHHDTLISLAILLDKKDALKTFVKSGVDLNKIQVNNNSPAVYAANIFKNETLKVLLSLKADLFQEDIQKTSAISIILKRTAFYKDLIELIIADVIKNGKTAYLKQLAEQKSLDFNKIDLLGRSYVFLAAQYGHAEMIPILASLTDDKQIDFNKPDKYGRTPAFIAAENGFVDVLKQLAQCNVDFNQPDTIGTTPLMIAEKMGNHTCQRFLTETTKQHVSSSAFKYHMK